MRAVILLALVGAVVGVPRIGQRIVGGETTTIQQYPFTVNLNYLWYGVIWDQFCGGTLITQKSVVTAAHCVEDYPIPRYYRARLGSTQRSSGGTLNNVVSIVYHNGYSDAHLNNDIAIVTLNDRVSLSNSIGIARVAGPNYNLGVGAAVTSIGWGHTTYRGEPSETLLHVTTSVVDQNLCAERYAYLKTQPGYWGWPDITPQMLCAGALNVGGKDACQGDSGGPLVHQGDVLVGVTSWGFECADAFYPGVNARVSMFTDWIKANSVE